MNLVDSGPRLVHASAFNADRGAISEGRPPVTLTEEDGAPDGLTVDAGGDLWVAVNGGGQVRGYSADGILRQVLSVPCRASDALRLRRPRMNRLYVTTATEGWSGEQRRRNPAPGLVYRFEMDATGRPAANYCPNLRSWPNGPQ